MTIAARSLSKRYGARAALQAVSNAFSGAGPGIAGPLVHLAVLTLVFGALGRVTLRRFS